MNKSRPCPYGGYVLLRQRENNTVNKASNETVLIVALFEDMMGAVPLEGVLLQMEWLSKSSQRADI